MVEEIIGAAVQLVIARMPEQEIIVKIPEELHVTPMEYNLLTLLLLSNLFVQCDDRKIGYLTER